MTSKFERMPRSAVAAIVVLGILGLAGLIGPFLFGGRVLYGSMISWQFFPITANYFDLLRAGVYPLFSFNLGLGFDAVAESQQALLHPVKIIIALIASDYTAIDTAFLVFHLVLLVVSFGLCIFRFAGSERDVGTRLVAAAFGGIALTYGIAVYANFIHFFFIAALSYGVLLLVLVDHVLDEPTAPRLLAIVVVTTLMLLCGNFVIQWIFLFSLMVYGTARLHLLKLSFGRGVPVLVAIAIGFVVAAPQLFPTFEVMQVSARATAGGFDKFAQSAGPLQWFAYLAPGAAYAVFEHAPSVYAFSGGNNVVEGIHYVGLITVALFLCAIRDARQMPWRITILTFCALLMALRSMGVFSPLNILLNLLPVFGQFRFPVRSFFMIDVFVCLVAALFLMRPFDRESVGQMLSFLTRVIAAVVALALVVAVIGSLLSTGSLPRIGWAEAVYVFASLSVAWGGQRLMRARALSHRAAVLALCVLALVDLSVHRAGAPTHWRSPTAEQLAERTSLVDHLCESAGASRIYVESLWPQFDLPIFPFRASSARHYATTETASTPELNGDRCTLTYLLITSTLTPTSTLALNAWMMTRLDASQRRELLSFIGFDHYASLTADAGRSVPAKEITIAATPAPRDALVEALAQFVSQQPPPRATIFYGLLAPIYRGIVASGLRYLLPSDVRAPHRLPGVGTVIALNPPFSYMLLQGKEVVQPIAVKGSFVLLPESVVDPVTVIYVPAAFIVGLFVSACGLVFAVIFLGWVARSRRQYADGEGRTHRALTRLAWMVTGGVRRAIESRRLQIYFGALTAMVGIGMASVEYLLGNVAVITLGMTIVALFVAIIYKITEFVSADRRLSRGVTVLIAFSYVLGQALFTSHSFVSSHPALKQKIMTLLKLFG